MRYFGRVFRPPSEAYSLIIQATIGCSHNKCAFCEMYKEKHFRIRPTADVLEDLDMARAAYGRVERIFLADGDAMMIPQPRLLEILAHIKKVFPECKRVGIYASPTSLKIKTAEELAQLKDAGIGIAYLGLESGCEEVLARMNKGATAAEIVEAGLKVKAAGIALSVTAISGLGGKENWQAHAIDTAKALSAMKPEYIGLLTLMVNPGTPLHNWVRKGSFTPLDPREIACETRLMLEHLDSEGSVFRSNHASNYVALAGNLNADREALLAKLDRALEGDRFRSEMARRF